MSTQPPRGRQPRSGGGRALMLLGVVLALLSGVLVIFIVSNATSSAGATDQLVVANQAISSGTALSPSDFTVKSFPVADVPAGAYVFTTQDALNVTLNQTYATENLVVGDILLVSDPRIGKGSAIPGSIANIDPGALKAGDVLFPLTYSNPSSGGQAFIVTGDHIDVIVTECGADFTTDGCATQTTFQNLLVYATLGGNLLIVMSAQNAQVLKAIEQTGNVTLAVRNPQDTSQPSTVAVTPSYVAHQFGFN